MAASFLIQAKESGAVQNGEQLTRLLKTIGQDLPLMVRPALKVTMKEISKDLPRRPSTGRRRVLTLEEKKVACNLVNSFHFAGDSMRTAYAKTADQMNVSPRTVQRAWRERKQFLGETKIAVARPQPTPERKG
jgi:hypothetical protein